MDERTQLRYYAAPDIIVSYDAARCLHVGECLRRLPTVFDRNRRPWVLPTAAGPDEIAAVIERCPSGALHYARLDGHSGEEPEEPTTVTMAQDGPLYVRGRLELRAADGSLLLEETRTALCRCGRSRNKPFCDNSHRG